MDSTRKEEGGAVVRNERYEVWCGADLAAWLMAIGDEDPKTVSGSDIVGSYVYKVMADEDASIYFMCASRFGLAASERLDAGEKEAVGAYMSAKFPDPAVGWSEVVSC